MTTEALTDTRRDWPDIGYSALWTNKGGEYADVVANFVLLEHQGYDADGDGGFTVPRFWRKGSCTNMDAVNDPLEAEHEITYAVKWDGCSNLAIDGDTTLHFCDREGVEHFNAALLRMFEWATELGMNRL